MNRRKLFQKITIVSLEKILYTLLKVQINQRYSVKQQAFYFKLHYPWVNVEISIQLKQKLE